MQISVFPRVEFGFVLCRHLGLCALVSGAAGTTEGVLHNVGIFYTLFGKAWGWFCVEISLLMEFRIRSFVGRWECGTFVSCR